jgi:coenzyme F420-reducing hydrogenase gamma subunit
MKPKPRVAFFDFACCEGCQLQVANLGEALLDVLALADVVEFREVMSEKWEGTYDVAVVEGSITTKEAVERIARIRERTKVLVAYGACATIGGVNGMRNRHNIEDIRRTVYGDKAHFFPTIETRAVDQVVKVDYYVHGCPIYPPEFLKVLQSILMGIPCLPPDHAVCVECKLNENICLYEKGVTCLGPVTRAGCNSWCTNHGNICYGCRGLVSNPNESGAADVLARYHLTAGQIANRMGMYNRCRQPGKKA